MATTNIKAEAQKLLTALGMSCCMYESEARAKGYRPVRELAELVGCSEDLMQRKVREKNKLFDSVKVNRSGGPTFYKLKK